MVKGAKEIFNCNEQKEEDGSRPQLHTKVSGKKSRNGKEGRKD